jgi:type II secretory pathway component GspD/PulD (secretin)
MWGFGGPGKRAVMTTLFRSKDGFNTRYQEGSLVITVTGSITDGKSKVKKIHIRDGGKSETHESLEKVPEQYRDKVKNLIEMSEKNNLKIEVGANFEILRLKNAKAEDAANVLDEAFNGKKQNQNSSDDWNWAYRMLQQKKQNTIRVVADPSTNSLLVNASPLDMLTIRNIVEEYIDNNKINEKAIIKTWKLGPFQHANAKDVYWLIKDVYREHLNKQLDLIGKGAFRNSFIYGMQSRNTDQNGQPRGVDLSVTYDEQTNAVFVNCNKPMYEEIDKLVKDYEQDAKKESERRR